MFGTARKREEQAKAAISVHGTIALELVTRTVVHDGRSYRDTDEGGWKLGVRRGRCHRQVTSRARSRLTANAHLGQTSPSSMTDCH